MSIQAVNEVDSQESIRFFNLDKVRFIIKDATALDVAYAYDDLVFSENAVFILQFCDGSDSAFNCYFNVDCIEANRIVMLASLNATAELNATTINYKGKFELIKSNKEDSFDIRFL
jgi:hypothetical protein